MIARPLPSLFAFAIALVGLWACSSGLGKDPRKKNGAPAGSNVNLPLGLDLGVLPTDPVAEAVVAGLVVPAIGSTPAREVVFVGFSTAAASNNADGAGTPLSRDATADSNGAADVFVALVSANDVEKRAFSQSLAGKFRNPRCATCHSMAVPGTSAFVSSASGAGQPHAGPPPGAGFPNNQPQVCAPCHVTSSTFPVPGWQAPAASFDMKSKNVAQLAQMAMNVPVDQTEHFVSDTRVLWALDSGILPQVGGRNGRADDDHDGIFEPEDVDGTPRTVPGGSAVFIQQIQDWRASGMVVSTASAVKDVTLVSRQAGTSNAANGESTAPKLVWVPNPGFNPGNPAATNPIGTLFVAFQSTASNLTGGDANGVMDVFRAAVQLRAEEDATGAASVGGLNLVVQNATILCSARDTLTTSGNGASGRPAISGPNAEFVAFESAATNLTGGFANNNGGGLDVFVRKVGSNTTQLVSHQSGVAGAGGNGSSEAPSISSSGGFLAVAYESSASNLLSIADGNGVRDVFFADVSGVGPFATGRASVNDSGAEGTVGACRAASVHTDAAGRVLVAFESDKADLDALATAATNVFLFDSAAGATTLLNRLLGPTGNAIGDGPARSPVIAPDGSIVAFESDAMNIDVVEADENRDGDVFLVETSQVANGLVLPFRISVTTRERTAANGASRLPSFGTFTGSTNFRTGFACYLTDATNLGTSDTTDVVVAFLDETSGVIAEFSATPLAGVAPYQVAFTDSSSGSPTGWEWDFDNDGTVDSTLQNPTHIYGTPGDFTVRLVARNANTSGEKIATSLVHVTGPAAADFTAAPVTTGSVPLVVLFTDTSSQVNGSITGWAWDFENDGTIDSTLQNPTHTYPAQGTFAVRLVATGQLSTDTEIKTGFLTVQPPGAITAAFTSIVTASAVPSRIGTSVGSVYNDETVTFTDTSVGTVSSRTWDFGDGATSTLQNPTHIFATPGTYNVILTVTGPGGTDLEVRPALITSVGGQSTIIIEPIKDTSIYSNTTTNSNGANAEIVCGRAYNNTTDFGIRRAFLEFDVAGNVPAGSAIISANLQMTCTYNPSSPTGAQTITLRRVTTEWGEAGSSGGIGGGAAGQTGDATWASAFVGSAAWGTAGGDFVGTISASTSVNTAGTYNWATNAQMISDAQLWLNTPTSNHGWVVRSAGEAVNTRTTKVFGSRTNSTVANRPKLTLTFKPPLP